MPVDHLSEGESGRGARSLLGDHPRIVPMGFFRFFFFFFFFLVIQFLSLKALARALKEPHNKTGAIPFNSNSEIPEILQLFNSYHCLTV